MSLKSPLIGEGALLILVFGFITALSGRYTNGRRVERLITNPARVCVCGWMETNLRSGSGLFAAQFSHPVESDESPEEGLQGIGIQERMIPFDDVEIQWKLPICKYEEGE